MQTHINKDAYRASLILLAAIVMGCVIGLLSKEAAMKLKFLGDIFLNLLFSAVVPLVFFSISSAVAEVKDMKRLGRITAYMLLIFTITGVIASILMLLGITLFPVPPFPPLPASELNVETMEKVTSLQQIVNAFTVSDFPLLLSRKNMLPLIVFAMLLGLSTNAAGEKGKPFAAVLSSGTEVMLKLIHNIMYFAPIGLGAYFAHLIGVFGKDLLTSMGIALGLYYVLSILYFFIAFTAYAYWAGKRKGVETFWKNAIPVTLTALGTQSSMATIPVNIDAANKTGVPKDISEVIIPIGATIHMDGSCMSAILKIAVIMTMLGNPLDSPLEMLTAIGVAILSGMVMSGIPGGGSVGELLIASLYGFPPATTLPIMLSIGALVDPPATVVNAVGDNVASMMVARAMEGEDWMEKGEM
ncbi:MAG: dicarboxylate/amino acid:cation symporter [Bacteroidia bacterium]